MAARIFITGVGVISPIGNTTGENLNSLRAGICGLAHSKFLNSRYSDLFPFGEVKLSTEALKEKLELSGPGISRTTLLALHAFNEAVKQSGLGEHELSDASTAFIGANTVGGMCLTDEMYRDANMLSDHSEYLSSYDFASPTIYIQEKYKMNGLINTINTACSSSANAIMYGARLIKNGLAERAIVGGCDSLSKFTVNGFNSLGILSNEICRPFDNRRKGLNLGEGAAFLVLEKEEHLGNKKIYAELTGYFNSNDAYHPSSLSETGEGPFLSMTGALNSASLKPGDIDFINTHGTATENNDLVESHAMLRVFENIPAFTSTKSNIGHTLGASGSIEASFSILNLEHQEIFPGLNFSDPIETTGLKPNIKFTKKKLKHILSNSFGFGGNCSSLIFSKA